MSEAAITCSCSARKLGFSFTLSPYGNWIGRVCRQWLDQGEQKKECVLQQRQLLSVACCVHLCIVAVLSLGLICAIQHDLRLCWSVEGYLHLLSSADLIGLHHCCVCRMPARRVDTGLLGMWLLPRLSREQVLLHLCQGVSDQ